MEMIVRLRSDFVIDQEVQNHATCALSEKDELHCEKEVDRCR
jgi:hypothetical protein